MVVMLRFGEDGLGRADVPCRVLAGRPGLRGAQLTLDEEPGSAPHRGAPGLQRTIALAHRKDVAPTHAAQAFRQALVRHVREAAESGSLPPGVQSLVAP